MRRRCEIRATFVALVLSTPALLASSAHAQTPVPLGRDLMVPRTGLFDDGLWVGDRAVAAIVVEAEGRIGFAEVDAQREWPLGQPPPVHAQAGYIAPFFTELVVEGCPGRETAGVQAHTEPPAVASEHAYVVVFEWVDATDSACSPISLTFRAELHIDGARRLRRVVFHYDNLSYTQLPPGMTAPRIGVSLFGETVEFLPPMPDLPTSRRRQILLGESSDDGGSPGMWVVELTADGSVAGDVDRDGVRDGRDNCNLPNPWQFDINCDGRGDACHLPAVPLLDTDGDRIGDICDLDDDGDGVADRFDNCQLVFNDGQLDLDGDRRGDACDHDPDGDGVPTLGLLGGAPDVCPFAPDPAQSDLDGDGFGDACDLLPRVDFGRRLGVAWDADTDGDRVPDVADGCPHTPDPSQVDSDGDGRGDACEAISERSDICLWSPVGWYGACWSDRPLPFHGRFE